MLITDKRVSVGLFIGDRELPPVDLAVSPISLVEGGGAQTITGARYVEPQPVAGR